MNTQQINRIMYSDRHVGRIYMGTKACDRITAPDFPVSAYIINTDRAQAPGKHWLAIFIDNGKGTFFDSYGRHPDSYDPLVKKFLQQSCHAWKCSHRRQTQQFGTAVCAQHAMMYLFFRARNFTNAKIVNMYSADADTNDKIANQFVNSMYAISAPLYESVTQTCECL
jgi:hypothetical protein